jgi:hypothetical protein
MKFKFVYKSITKNEDQKMNKHVYLTALILICLVVSGCASWFANYGKVKNLTGDRKKDVTIDTLIENWGDYDIYYAGQGVKLPLGIMFDPKENNTKLTGDRWQKVVNQKTLIEITGWIYLTTLEFPWLAELLGPNDQFLGYLYYSGGPASLKKIDDSTFYVFGLENPDDRRDGHP